MAAELKNPSFPHERLIVKRWQHMETAYNCHPVRSDYVEQFWLPLIGPTTMLLIRNLDRELTANNGVLWLECSGWSRRLGLGKKGGRNSPLWRSIERASRFSIVYLEHNSLYVKQDLPELKSHQLGSLTGDLVIAHQQHLRLPVAKNLG